MTEFLNKQSTAELLSRLVDLLYVSPPPMPRPPGAPWDTSEDRRVKWSYKDEESTGRLLALGASADDLNGFARSVRALAIADVLNALDLEGEGELAGEFYGTYLELPDP